MAGINHASISMSASDGVQGRKRNVTIAGMDSSPGSIEDMDDNDSRDDKRRQPVKRACNECRQQKVSAILSHGMRRLQVATLAVPYLDQRPLLIQSIHCSFDAMLFKIPGPIVPDVGD
jgi:hypothetical protein